MKKVFFLTCVFFCVVLLSGATQSVIKVESVSDEPAVLNGDWQIAYGDDSRWALPAEQAGTTESVWKTIGMPIQLDLPMPPDDRYFWIRTQFSLAASLQNKNLYYLAGKQKGALEYYLNGTLVFTHGAYPPGFHYKEGMGKQFLLPPDLLRFDAPNTMSIRVYSNEANITIRPPRIGDSEVYRFDSTLLTFFNMDIHMILSIVCLFIGLYFFFQFLFNRKYRTNLYFALANIFFAVYFFEMGLEPQLFDNFLRYHAISKSVLPLSFGFLALFYVEYFEIHNKTWLKIFFISLAAVLTFMIAVLSRDLGEVNTYFTLSLVPGQLEIFFMAYIAVRAVLGKNRDAVPILIGTVIGVGMGSSDIFSQYSGIEPFMWLQSIGIFLFNVSMFVSLSMRSNRINTEMERYSKDIEAKSRELKLFVDNIGEVSRTVAGTSTRLDSDITRASDAVQSVSSKSNSISSEIDLQLEKAENTEQTTARLLSSMDSMFSQIDSQSRRIATAADTIDGMIGSLENLSTEINIPQISRTNSIWSPTRGRNRYSPPPGRWERSRRFPLPSIPSSRR